MTVLSADYMAKRRRVLDRAVRARAAIARRGPSVTWWLRNRAADPSELFVESIRAEFARLWREEG